MTRRERILVAALFALLLLACGLLYQSQAAPAWEWDESAGADGYYLRWSWSPVEWPECQRLDVGDTLAFDDAALWPMLPDRPGFVTYFIVTAYNNVGESPTEHGPVVPCPVELCL